MNPFKYAEMMKYLTRAKKQKPDLPDVFPASKAPIPAKTQNVQETEAVNQFMLRNPRKDMANGGSLKFYPKASGGETTQQIAPGVDLKTRDINYGGTLGYEGDKVYGGVEYNTGKVKFDITDTEGNTLFKDTLSKDDAVNFIVGLGDPKGEKFQIKTDKDFNNMQVVFRKSFADGGMLVQPSADGSRPGYADEKTMLKAAGKELRELYNNDKLTKKIIELVKKEPDNYDSVLKKINSYKGNKYKYSSNNLSNVLTVLANENRIDSKYTVDKTGTPKYIVNKRNEKIDKLINVDPDKLPTAASVAKKVGVTTTTVTNYLKKSKGEDWVEQNYGKERFKRYGDIPLRTQFLNYVLNNPIEKFTVKNIIKNTDIKTKKEANSIYSKLLSDIYDKRAPNIDRPVKYIDENINLKDLTKKLRSSDDFYDAYERKIGSLLLEAYDGNLNSKEYKKARNTLTAYHNFIRPLNKKYPSIAQTIEHPIPYTFLTEVDAGKDPKNLINTTILGDKENTFKSKIDEVKIKLRRNLEKNPNDQKLLTQVEDMKKLETFLTKKTGMGFGTIKANFTDPKIQDLDFGAKTFGKDKIVPQIKKSLEVREKTVDFFNKFKNDPKVINLFENAGVSAKVFRMLGGLRKGNVPLFLKEMDNILKNNPILKDKLSELPIFDEYSDIQNQYAALDTGTMSDVNMNLSLPESVKKEVVPAEAIGAATLPIVERGKKILSGLGKGIAGIDLPLVQAAFAVADPTSLFYTLPFTDLAAKQTNLYKPAKTKTGQVIKSVLRGAPAKVAERVFPMVSRASIPVSLGYGVSEVAKAAKPNYYIDSQTGEPTFYNRDFAQNVLPGFIDLADQAANIAKKEGVSYQEALNKTNVEDFVSNVQGPGKTIKPFAGGGIAKMAGVSSGVAPESGPNPQGLLSLKNRVRNY